ncbi:MAG: aminotransferase class V-fold PLP-dependent enzyme [Archangiaceae bacterium]|nr:aminotransferase class V-fold PLP-dependent enzyme [Archangiaceae bacterium]
MTLKAHFSRVLGAAPGRLHFAAHSHHPWPDVSFDAHQQAWLDAARHLDHKWDVVFGEVIPEAQRHVASELGLSDPSTLVFAPNTHEFVLRLLSCLPEKPRIVTSDSEFHSFERQISRLNEDGLVQVTRVPSEPFDTFPQRLIDASKDAQLVFVSHVFFNSGAVLRDVDALVKALPASAMVVLDGYHGFCAVPTSLKAIEDRCFYVAGGYKYAMAGEGACFLHVPKSTSFRPRNTGWFAAFGALQEKSKDRVPYASSGGAFMGATFDPSGLYRLNAVMRWRQSVGFTTPVARAHAHALQQRFLAGLSESTLVRSEQLVVADSQRGQFLTFRTSDAKGLSAELQTRNVITDARDDRLRFGFGPYQDEGDVEQVLGRLRKR